MTAADEPSLLDPTERPAARVLNPRGAAPAVLACEHASRFIPASLNGLGLSDAAARSHAAWDIGALDLARDLAGRLDAPLVASRISRLVYDCNRPPEAPGAIPAQSEVFAIPGNHGLDDTARAARIHQVYEPFRALLAQVLDHRPTRPALITIHSFTPVFDGRARAVELGVLHDADARMARALAAGARRDTPLRVEMNQPYSAADGVTHTLRLHGESRGLANVMIEIRNDLIDTARGVARIAAMLAPILNHTIRQFGETRQEGART